MGGFGGGVGFAAGGWGLGGEGDAFDGVFGFSTMAIPLTYYLLHCAAFRSLRL